MDSEKKARIERELAECDRWECITVLALTWARLEYLEGQEQLKRTGFVQN